MLFYHFRQQNSNGQYIITDDIRINVIVAAQSMTEANATAWDLGLYFSADGVKNFSSADCEHCPVRWRRQFFDFAGSEQPTVFRSPVFIVPDLYKKWADTVIHYGGTTSSRRKLYAYGADIFKEGIPVPPDVAEHLRFRSFGRVAIGRKIIGGGWRLGYPRTDPQWVLATSPEVKEALSRAYCQETTDKSLIAVGSVLESAVMTEPYIPRQD
jgi:hypothetical protein